MHGLFNGPEIGKMALLTSQPAMTKFGFIMVNINTAKCFRQGMDIASAMTFATPRGNEDSIEINGIDSTESTDYKTDYALLVQLIENQWQYVQEVSADEEMTDLVRIRNLYDTSARVISAMDQALDTLINGTGLLVDNYLQGL
jgi:flagellar hook-associated protein FlgK